MAAVARRFHLDASRRDVVCIDGYMAAVARQFHLDAARRDIGRHALACRDDDSVSPEDLLS